MQLSDYSRNHSLTLCVASPALVFVGFPLRRQEHKLCEEPDNQYRSSLIRQTVQSSITPMNGSFWMPLWHKLYRSLFQLDGVHQGL
ncbi:hypothetical protein QQF64_021495 [Cirrhinus molitorella]|uniref:Uncharacterized protein n=1 Tax=Cirrhinus molitorella TaxID=172907 RepID=A0ABR3L5N5_9TELE